MARTRGPHKIQWDVPEPAARTGRRTVLAACLVVSAVAGIGLAASPFGLNDRANAEGAHAAVTVRLDDLPPPEPEGPILSPAAAGAATPTPDDGRASPLRRIAPTRPAVVPPVAEERRALADAETIRAAIADASGAAKATAAVEAAAPSASAMAGPDAPAGHDASSGGDTSNRGVIRSGVSMRAAGKPGARVIANLRRGTTVEIVKCRRWCEIDANGRKGFVFATFVEKD